MVIVVVCCVYHVVRELKVDFSETWWWANQRPAPIGKLGYGLGLGFRKPEGWGIGGRLEFRVRGIL